MTDETVSTKVSLVRQPRQDTLAERLARPLPSYAPPADWGIASRAAEGNRLTAVAVDLAIRQGHAEMPVIRHRVMTGESA